MTASDDDMIRRGDALKALDWRDIYGRAANTQTAINAIPAVQVVVKPLEWVEIEKYRRGGKYSADGYTIRYVEGFFILDFAGEGKWKWRWTDIEAAKAAAQADYDARIRSALAVQPSPDVAALVDALLVARRAIVEGGGGGVTCTVWVPDDVCPAETLVDHIDAALARLKGGAA